MKRFKFKNPESLGFDKKMKLRVIETKNGYTMWVSGNSYIGFPKQIVEYNPDIFEFIDESDEISMIRQKRPRIIKT